MAEVKKIIIDEDWKSQVEAEKEAAAKAKSDPATAQGTEQESPAQGDPQMPPASLDLLVTSLATEALVALGQVPHPISGKVESQRNLAKYLIDTLDMLKQKTAGNLSQSEQQVLDTVLHQLQMVFVQTASEPAAK